MKSYELFSVLQAEYKTDSKGRKIQFEVALWDITEKGATTFYVAIQKCLNGKKFGVLQKGKPFKSARDAADYGYIVAGERLDKIDG